MTSSFTSDPEIQAEFAESLPAFSGIKLSHIKRELANLLGLIGRGGIFDSYTLHDISHVDAMLSLISWLVPDTTKSLMTPADWLLTVLGVYFHDLGMLVTREEYNDRARSGFPEFRDKRLYAGLEGEDYRAKLASLPAEDAERFLYQEFVRDRHAERIRAWITGKAADHLGVTHHVVEELASLLSPLDMKFRSDLALICESHHLDDLFDQAKYRTSQPYGNSDAETANLQYVAVLLRTADLLHITRDRTPSIMFRVISPADPLSQQEWAKQLAVRRVRPQLGRDKDGNFDAKAPRDTIEVHAYFTKVDGFFGLTSYLTYAQEQLRKSHEWVTNSRTRGLGRHEFPWRHLDDTNVQTEGFLRNTFEFTIDQAKVLDLLTGHTLYNDTRVVMRELIQNAIDAIRVQQLRERQLGKAWEGEVKIEWDTAMRTLTVTDNGTGMTQDDIESHLLKVGSSRYQDPEFKRQYPDFSSISRFGIGVLSTFMIADSVEITTCSTDEPSARQISLRSVHGKYLVRVLDKDGDPAARDLAPHGTRVKLTVRPSAEVVDVVASAKRWIVVPRCRVRVFIDRQDGVAIGYDSPKAALEDFLASLGFEQEGGREALSLRGPVRVREETREGVTLAFAVVWSEAFKEWEFFQLPDRLRRGAESEQETSRNMFGTCVEGVRVEFATPGMNNIGVVALANVTGPRSPRTNVARSGLEVTPELTDVLRNVYACYFNHVRAEMRELHERRSFSLTWAIEEARYLLWPILREERAPAVDFNLLLEEAKDLPLLLVENGDERRAATAKEVAGEEAFWTIDSAFFKSAERVMRELPGSGSLGKLISLFRIPDFRLPRGPVLCGDHSDALTERLVFAVREVDVIDVNRQHRRVDLRWSPRTTPPRWHRLDWDSRDSHYGRRIRDLVETLGPPGFGRVDTGRGDVKVVGVEKEIGVRAFGRTYLVPGTDIATFLSRLHREWKDDGSEVAALDYMVFSVLASYLLMRRERDIGGLIRTAETRVGARGAAAEEFESIARSTSWRVFDPTAWERGRERVRNFVYAEDEDFEFADEDEDEV